ncbi:MAG: class IV adenylate cyclase [Calditrichae bacterium]|nr:class IV adenylate cyclase [Calditrichota bacterium]MCB9057608.1 class IV adenylate cyclase [Calditrichia bacterium]
MGKNIEIKAECTDPEKVESIIIEKGWKSGGVENQKDTFFNVPNGRLKLRETNENQAVLIPYFRPDMNTLRDSEYVLLKTDETRQALSILKKMFGIRWIVSKKRKIYFYDNIRIHLDEVDSLGSFIEFEGVISDDKMYNETQEKLEWLIELFEIAQEQIFKEAYVDMLEKKDDTNAH